jgi:hypothetical protein
VSPKVKKNADKSEILTTKEVSFHKPPEKMNFHDLSLKNFLIYHILIAQGDFVVIMPYTYTVYFEQVHPPPL